VTDHIYSCDLMNITTKGPCVWQAYREANLHSAREPAPFKRSSSFLRASPSTLLSTPSGSQSQLFRTPSASVLHPMSTAIPEHSEVGAMPEVVPAVSDTDASDLGYFGGSDKGNYRVQTPSADDD